MTTAERDARIAYLEQQLEWADRLMVVLMARPKPPTWARFDNSDVREIATLERLLLNAREVLRVISTSGCAPTVRQLALNGLRVSE